MHIYPSIYPSCVFHLFLLIHVGAVARRLSASGLLAGATETGLCSPHVAPL